MAAGRQRGPSSFRTSRPPLSIREHTKRKWRKAKNMKKICTHTRDSENDARRMFIIPMLSYLARVSFRERDLVGNKIKIRLGQVPKDISPHPNQTGGNKSPRHTIRNTPHTGFPRPATHHLNLRMNAFAKYHTGQKTRVHTVPPFSGAKRDVDPSRSSPQAQRDGSPAIVSPTPLIIRAHMPAEVSFLSAPRPPLIHTSAAADLEYCTNDRIHMQTHRVGSISLYLD